MVPRQLVAAENRGMWDAIAALAGAAAVVVPLVGLISELRKTRREREKAQVGRVSAWLEPGSGQSRDLVIRNDSDAPIFAVRTAENAREPFKG
jgi:hypothetical protein